MRWNQANNLFIWLFLALNLGLGYLNYLRPTRVMAERGSSSAIYLRAIAELAQQGITLEQKPSLIPEKVAPLRLTPQTASSIAPLLLSSLFAGQHAEAERLLTLSGGEIWRYTTATAILEIAPNGQWSYRLQQDQPQATPAIALGYDQAKSIAESFLRAHHLELPAGAIAGAMRTLADNELQLVWYLSQKEMPIFDASLCITLVAGEVVALSSSLNVSTSVAGVQQWISSASDILLRLSRDEYLLDLVAAADAGQQLTIRTLTLGYFSRFNAGELNTTSIAYPTWCVLLASGEALYYDAFGGQRVYP